VMATTPWHLGEFQDQRLKPWVGFQRSSPRCRSVDQQKSTSRCERARDHPAWQRLAPAL